MSLVTNVILTVPLEEGVYVNKVNGWLQVREGRMPMTGIACSCGLEMVTDGAWLLSNPPTRSYTCIVCGRRELVR